VSAEPGKDAAGADLIVPLRSRRRARAQTGQKLQHLIPAAGLLFSGVQSLMAGVDGLERALAIVGIVTSALLMTAFGRHLRTRRNPADSHTAHGIDWMDVWAAGVLFAEAAEKWRIRGHIWRPETLAALATLGVGLMHGRLAAAGERRRSLHVTSEELSIGGLLRFSRRFTARWSEIAAIEIREHEATVRTHRGRKRRINLADLDNAPAVRAALQEAERRLADHAGLTASHPAVTVTP
jgi:hypothetical protein